MYLRVPYWVPFYFLLYVNDIYDVSNLLSCIQFADDTTLFATGPNLTDLVCAINTELNHINAWINLNKLSLNASKTNYMILSSARKEYDPSNPVLHFGGQIIQRVESTKFLGVIIDDSLTWKLHIDHICSKASKGIGILRRARQVLYGQSLLTLYHALLKPHFTYFGTVWGNTYQTHLQKLNVIQTKLVRTIICSELYAHTAQLLQNTEHKSTS